MTKKTTERLKRDKEIEEILDAGDICFERLKNKKREGLQFKNLEHHKRTQMVFEALKDDDSLTKVNGANV